MGLHDADIISNCPIKNVVRVDKHVNGECPYLQKKQDTSNCCHFSLENFFMQMSYGIGIISNYSIKNCVQS